MKCPSCGAEIGNSNSCEFCGTRITSAMLQEQEQLNKQGCPKCGSTNISFSREKQGDVKGKRGSAVIRSTVGLCKDCGHTWHIKESGQSKPRKTWLWVIGWILLFPLPLTILLLRKKDMKPALKYGIIAAAWIIYVVIGLAGNSNDKADKTIKTTPKTETAETVSNGGNRSEPTPGTTTTADTSRGSVSAQTPTNTADDAKETLKKELKASKGLVWFGSVNNDTTGNWRLAEYSSAADSQETFAADYYKAYFEDNKEIHAVINMTNKTTARLSMLSDNIIDVTILNYVNGEEHSAKTLFSGSVIKTYWVYLDTGSVKEVS